MSASHYRVIRDHSGSASFDGEKARRLRKDLHEQKKSASAKPYRFGIKINRPKTDSMAEKALQIEANRAKRFVGEMNQNDLKMPIPRIPAVLAYLRWLDKMDAWHRRSGSIQETSARLRDTEDLYSWNTGFGAPVVLPKIRKHPNPEKYRSKQVAKTMLDPELEGSNSGYPHPDFAGAVRNKRAMRQTRAAHVLSNSHQSTGHRSRGDGSEYADEYGNRTGGDGMGKHTKFYIHAMNGFKYWPMEKYNPPVHHTKYAFGNQFHSGRAGVVTDRIYTRPRSNKHYWADFQLRQNPIGSGNNVAGRVLSN